MAETNGQGVGGIAGCPTMALPTPLPRRLNLGCGYDIRPAFLNVDLMEHHHPDLVADITNLPMLPSAWFEEIVATDVLEHIARPKIEDTLREWTRLLAPRGTMQIRVPSLLHLAALLLQPENQVADRANDIIHYMYGTQAYTGDYHLSGFTASTINDLLSKVGLYANTVDIKDGWMFDFEASRAS